MNTLRIATHAVATGRKEADEAMDGTMMTAVASTILQQWAQKIVVQPDLDFSAVSPDRRDQVPPTSAHLATARGNANRFLNVVNPEMWSAISEISAFGNVVDAFEGRVDPAVERAFEGDPKAAELVLRLVQALDKDAERRRDRAMTALGLVTALRTDFSDDAANFNSDVQALAALLDGDMGELSAIADSLEDYDEMLSQAAANQTASIFGIVGGAALIVLGTPFGLAPVGVGVLTAGAVGTGVTTDLIGRENAAKVELLGRQDALEASMMLLADAKSTMGQLADGATMAAAAMQTLVNAWTNLRNNTQQIVNLTEVAMADAQAAIESGADPELVGIDLVVVREMLRAVNAQWEIVSEQSLMFQRQFQALDVRAVDDFADAFAA